jgi:hypothetical protein
MGLSLRAYAALRGVPMPAVREAIAAGRIKEELIAGSIQRENNGHLPSINASLVKRRYSQELGGQPFTQGRRASAGSCARRTALSHD